MMMSDQVKAEEIFPISEQGYTVGKLLDGTQCEIHLDTGGSKSFMSKTHYLRCKSLQFFTEICVQNSENSSRKWTVC